MNMLNQIINATDTGVVDTTVNVDTITEDININPIFILPKRGAKLAPLFFYILFYVFYKNFNSLINLLCIVAV